MMRWALLSSLVLVLAACSTKPVNRAVPVAADAVPPGLCRVGVDSGIPDTLADRGIGGTGITQVTDRGIGGTGQRTGLVGVITGFASVCLNGEEVQYPQGVAVVADDRPASLDQLRAGQVAVIEAAGGTAVSLAIRHEVSGPLQRIEPDGALRIAGQRVLLPPNTPTPALGTWLLVSGFHLADGTIAASRIDSRGAGEVLVRGILASDRGHLYIGQLEVRPARNQPRPLGLPITAIGRLNGTVFEADTIEPDALLLDPGAYFGPRVTALLIEGYAEGGYLGYGRRLRVGGSNSGHALARLVREPGGAFTPAFVRPLGPSLGDIGGATRSVFDRAPTADRNVEKGTRSSGELGGAGSRSGFLNRGRDGGIGEPGSFGAGEGARPRGGRR